MYAKLAGREICESCRCKRSELAVPYIQAAVLTARNRTQGVGAHAVVVLRL
jgi:hypothetical protein